MSTDKDTIVESIAELMEDADTLLEQVGIAVNEAVEDPGDYVEQLAGILDEVDLPEAVEELLCLNIAITEMLVTEVKALEETEAADDGVELDERSPLARLHKSLRRSLEKRNVTTHFGGKQSPEHWKGKAGDKLASKEAHSVIHAYMDRRKKVLPMKPKTQEPQKHAVGEAAECQGCCKKCCSKASAETP